MDVLGIDIGGTSIKGAPVELHTGHLLKPIIQEPTPQPATPDAVLETVAQIVDRFEWAGPIGCAVPAVVQQGVIRTATNIDPTWLNLDAQQRLNDQFKRCVSLINDADAAGCAEMQFGAGRDQPGTVLMVTLGTGIGTALFNNGVLVPNLELGQISVRGRPGHEWAAASVREEQGLSWEAWAQGLTNVLQHLETLVWPQLIILGGGISEEADRFLPLLSLNAKFTPAQLTADAGIIGAAWMATQSQFSSQ